MIPINKEISKLETIVNLGEKYNILKQINKKKCKIILTQDKDRSMFTFVFFIKPMPTLEVKDDVYVGFTKQIRSKKLSKMSIQKYKKFINHSVKKAIRGLTIDVFV